MSPSGATRVAGIIGWPVHHAKSPRLHTYWLNQAGIDGAYLPFPVQPTALEQVLDALPLMGVVGVNLTIPHKETALGLVDDVDPLARRIGAINTIIIDSDGKRLGRNTDVFGFRENIRQAYPTFCAANGPAVVLGAGGAARAVIAALIEEGCPDIRVSNRNHARAESLASHWGYPVRTVAWEQRNESLDGAGLLVNATSLGMTGQPPLVIDLDFLPVNAVVNDTVYAPLETALLAAARHRGNPAVDGLGMLLHQARPAFAAWFGVEPAVTTEVRAIMERL